MKMLIVCSSNTGKIAPFVLDQCQALDKLGVGIDIDYFTIEGKGASGYISNLARLKFKIAGFQPDIIHAHYGLSGLLANLQRKVPVVTTYHGSDINFWKIYPLSVFCMFLSAWNVYVSEETLGKSTGFFPFTFLKRKASLIACGVDTELFVPADKQLARSEMDFAPDEKLVLFAGSFRDRVKNLPLAKEAVNLVPNARLVELKGYTRKQVATMMSAVDVCLMTSFSEGSPQFIKEAMSCNCPVVSVDVGDVKEVISGVSGCHVVHRDAAEIADKIDDVIAAGKRTTGRNRIQELCLDNRDVAARIYGIYQRVLNR